jgi:hypothetical protein
VSITGSMKTEAGEKGTYKYDECDDSIWRHKEVMSPYPNLNSIEHTLAARDIAV